MKQKRSIQSLSRKTQKKLLIIGVTCILGLFGINSQPAQDFINEYFDTVSAEVSSSSEVRGNESVSGEFETFSLVADAAQYAKQVTNPDTQSEECQVLRVVDGDTLIVRLNKNKQQVRIRLIGIDAPESVHPDAARNSAKGKTASEHLKAGLHKGDKVYLTYDKEKTDKYQRTLAYVWLGLPPENPTEEDVEHLMLNGILVAEGYAKPKAFKPNTHFKSTFEAIARKH